MEYKISYRLILLKALLKCYIWIFHFKFRYTFNLRAEGHIKKHQLWTCFQDPVWANTKNDTENETKRRGNGIITPCSTALELKALCYTLISVLEGVHQSSPDAQ